MREDQIGACDQRLHDFGELRFVDHADGTLIVADARNIVEQVQAVMLREKPWHGTCEAMLEGGVSSRMLARACLASCSRCISNNRNGVYPCNEEVS